MKHLSFTRKTIVVFRDTISKSVFNNHFILDKRIGLGSIGVISLTRYFNSSRSFSSSIPLANKPESLALEHINSEKPTTWSTINKILLNQNLSVTDPKLDKLLKVKGVELDLPIPTPENIQLLAELTGKSKYKGFSGVYIFIHNNTGHKYVGSSNLLRRRMDYYFKGDFPLVGKLLPLLHKEGLKAFKLIIFKLDSNIFSNQDALILEQYYLLNKEFNLNTLRVVNAGSSKGDPVYVYDLTCSTLYYHAKSNIELKRVLKIHTKTSKKYVDSKIPYLNKFLLLSYYIPTALTSNISVGNTFVNSDSIGQTLNFDSLTSCIVYLRELGLTIKRATLTKYIKNEKVFHNFLCKYSDKILPDNFEQVGLIIDEYTKLIVDTDLDSLKVNRKNKPVLVKGENFEKEFESITDTIKYFDTLNIKLDRKALYLHLKNDKRYKDYYFSHK